MMRTNIHTEERGIICVNTYILNLMPSGFGKGHSTNIFEENLICGFKKKFLTEVFPTRSEFRLIQIAAARATRDNIDEEKSFEKVQKEFESLGVLPFSFDAATAPAIKQLRQKLLMSSAGSMNIEMDEIAQNLLGNQEALDVLFELYDKGLVKPKLTKNTKENIRSEDIEGYTPTNLMMFGTPIRLLGGGKVEEGFNNLLNSGYARRLLFGYSTSETNHTEMTATEIYNSLTDKKVSAEEAWLRNYFTNLAELSNFGKQIDMDKPVSIDLIQYQLDCEKKATKFSKFDEMSKAEMTHRYFKVLKLSGAYTFIDKKLSISQTTLNDAIELVEESGHNFTRIVSRDAPYIRLAKYLAEVDHDVTNVDLIENLQFYKGTEVQRKNMMTLAIAYGYSNNIIIKRSEVDDIEFFSGEALEKTDITKIPLSYSKDITLNFKNDYAPFDQLHNLTQLEDYHFITHHLTDGHRRTESIKKGTNLCVLDIDEGTQLHVATRLLEKFQFIAYTTKRHTDRKNRFRLILPLSHTVKLSEADHKQFMRNIYAWLPFDADTATCDRPRKWATHKGIFQYNEGQLLDVTRFIPRTDKAVKQQLSVESMSDLTAIQRWFMSQIKQGNRSNMLLRYALVLLDSGIEEADILSRIVALNNKLSNPISNDEINSTIMKTVYKRINGAK